MVPSWPRGTGVMGQERISDSIGGGLFRQEQKCDLQWKGVEWKMLVGKSTGPQ